MNAHEWLMEHSAATGKQLVRGPGRPEPCTPSSPHKLTPRLVRCKAHRFLPRAEARGFLGALPVNCSIPRQGCPIVEEVEGELRCARSGCDWTYTNPRSDGPMQDVVNGELIRTFEVRTIDSAGQTVLDGAGRPLCGTTVVTRTDRPGEYGFTMNRGHWGNKQDIEEYLLIDPREKRLADGPVRQ